MSRFQFPGELWVKQREGLAAPASANPSPSLVAGARQSPKAKIRQFEVELV
jgi:hypothetical protein